MLAIIDMDTLVYRAAGAAQKRDPITKELILEPVNNALANAKTMMLGILETTGCSDYEAFLTESSSTDCFRTALYPEYKANRKGKERPHYYADVRKYYLDQWGATVVSGIEADDAVSILQWDTYKSSFEEESGITIQFEECPAVLVGIDKDLLQIPGLHFNYLKNTFDYITPIQGLRSFYYQVLAGDRADNIPRIRKGWREHDFKGRLERCHSEDEMKELVLTIACEEKGFTEENIKEYLQWIGKLLYLHRIPNDSYRF